MASPDPRKNSKLSRRQSLQLGAASTVLLLALKDAATPAQAKDGGGTKVPPAPFWPPFVDALPVDLPLAAATTLVPTAGINPFVAIDPKSGKVDFNKTEAGRKPHQRFTEFLPKKFYELHAQESLHKFHRDAPNDQKVWAFKAKVDGKLQNQTIHGPTIQATYGQPNTVRFYNDLPANSQGFGSPEMSIHLHNEHTSSGCDGFTSDFFSRTKYYQLNGQSSPTGLSGPGAFRDHHYANIYAGYDQFPPEGDSREAGGTMWYHDHRLDSTAPNVYKGLAGFYLLFDKLDSDNEQYDPANPQALRLPSGVGVYDIPLMLQDLQFDFSGYLWFDSFNNDGFLGDKFAVNGKVQPYFKVANRKYRFRLLDASVSRFYQIYLTYQGKEQEFDYIANDGNLLPNKLIMNNVRLGPSERGDIVIDFSKYPVGSELFLVNRLEQVNGRGPTDTLLTPGTPVLKFVVDRQASADNSLVPLKLRELPDIDLLLKKVKKTRQFRFDRENGFWTVNGKIFDP